MPPTKRKSHNDLDSWRSEPKLAQHWRPIAGTDSVECTLSPRHCRIGNGQSGFCGVRRNVDGALFSDNFAQAVAAAEEVIETEAIYHYRPGARILSMGNIGCMMSCRFCQNWTTSQVKHLDTRVIQSMSPTEVIDIARHSETEELMVVYRCLYGDFSLWVRPLAMFLETVEVDGESLPRFALCPE